MAHEDYAFGWGPEGSGAYLGDELCKDFDLNGYLSDVSGYSEVY